MFASLRLTAPDRAPIDNGFLLSGPSALPAKHMFRHSSSSVIACPKDYSKFAHNVETPDALEQASRSRWKWMCCSDWRPELSMIRWGTGVLAQASIRTPYQKQLMDIAQPHFRMHLKGASQPLKALNKATTTGSDPCLASQCLTNAKIYLHCIWVRGPMYTLSNIKVLRKFLFPSPRTPWGFSPLVLASWLACYFPQIPPRIIALNPSKSCRNSDIVFSSFYARWVADTLCDSFARYLRICSHTRLDSAKRRPWTLLQHLRPLKATI